jgi:chromosome segregation ATPase
LPPLAGLKVNKRALGKPAKDWLEIAALCQSTMNRSEIDLAARIDNLQSAINHQQAEINILRINLRELKQERRDLKQERYRLRPIPES